MNNRNVGSSLTEKRFTPSENPPQRPKSRSRLYQVRLRKITAPVKALEEISYDFIFHLFIFTLDFYVVFSTHVFVFNHIKILNQ